MTMLKLTASKYNAAKGYQICGVCKSNMFKDIKVIKTEDDTIVTARCVRCGEINDMNPGEDNE